MTNDKWKDFNDMIGRIMVYVEEDGGKLSTRKAVKAELWEYYNEHVNGDEYDSKKETRGNH